MFFYYGKRRVKIKTYSEYQQFCSSCRNLELEINVYRSYAHLYFIPFFPVGPKEVASCCRNCKEITYSIVLTEHYQRITRTPIYFFSGLVLIGFLLTALINIRYEHQTRLSELVKDPKVGDEYKIRSDSNGSAIYYYFKIVNINGDTIRIYFNSKVYKKFISQKDADDYYRDDDEDLLLRSELEKMLNNSEINDIERKE